MIKRRRNTTLAFLLISMLLLVSFQSYGSYSLPPRLLYGTSTRSDGGSTSGASVVVSASGLQNEYTTVNSMQSWQVDVGGDTGDYWPDGTLFTVTIIMTGWLGIKTGTVTSTHTNAGNVMLYPDSGPLSVDAGVVYYGDVDEEVEFYGSASGGVTPYNWYWDFGDNTWSNEQNPIHIYSEPGTYIVTLKVTDYVSQSATDHANAIISGDSSLIAEANGPYDGIVYENIQFNGDVTGGIPPYSWFWDFGDGASSDEQNPSHIFSEPGEYSIILTVMDKNLNTDYDETICKVNIDNEPPLNPLISGLSEGESGEEYEYNFVTLDPEGDNVYYFIDWGDENNEGWLGPYDSGQSIDVTHSWNKQGYYTLKAKAKDIYGFESEWSEFEVEMPKSKSKTYQNNISIEFRGGLGLTIIIKNNGETTIPLGEIIFSIDAPWMLVGGETSTTITDIQPGGEERVNIGLLFGFGQFDATVNVLDISETRSGFMIGPFAVLKPLKK
jgi:PKD repeat protein